MTLHSPVVTASLNLCTIVVSLLDAPYRFMRVFAEEDQRCSHAFRVKVVQGWGTGGGGGVRSWLGAVVRLQTADPDIKATSSLTFGKSNQLLKPVARGLARKEGVMGLREDQGGRTRESGR